MKRKWLLALIGILVVGLAYLGYSLVVHTKDYITVTDFKSRAEYDQPAKVGGQVVPGSINWDERTKVLKFALSDDRETMTVVYKGVVPDEFKVGADLVVVGKYRQDTFEAVGFASRRSFCNLCHG